MADLLYLLNLYIPNLGEILGIIGLFMLIFGVANAFFGYRLFKILLSIIGFLVGSFIALSIFPQNASTEGNTLLLWVFIGGMIGSALAETFHKLGVFIAGGAMSAIIFLIITQDTTTALVLGVICGIIGVFFEKYAIIVTTSLSGGSLAATGLWFIRLSNGKSAGTQVWGFIIGICGIAFQLWRERNKPVDEKKESSIWVDIVADGVISVVSALSSLFKGNPDVNLHNPIYDKESNEVIRKKREELSPEGYVQRFSWENSFKALTNEKYVFCRECGAKLPKSARFCGNCGTEQE